MRRFPDSVAGMLDRPVDPQSINEYLRSVLIDRHSVRATTVTGLDWPY